MISIEELERVVREFDDRGTLWLLESLDNKFPDEIRIRFTKS